MDKGLECLESRLFCVDDAAADHDRDEIKNM